MDKRLCPVCGSENDESSEACIGCGYFLSGSNNQLYAGNSSAFVEAESDASLHINSADFASESTQTEACEIDFGGVSGTELLIFTGRKSIVDKFHSALLKNKSAIWSFAASMLSFLFGFWGAVVWFLQKKMYKIAALMLLLAVVTQISGYLILGEVREMKDITEFVETFLSMSDSSNLKEDIGNENTSQNKVVNYYDFKNQPLPKRDMAFNTFNLSVRIILFFVMGALALRLYKKYCFRKIKAYKSSLHNNDYYEGLSALGKKRIGILASGIIGLIFIRLAVIMVCALIIGV